MARPLADHQLPTNIWKLEVSQDPVVAQGVRGMRYGDFTTGRP